MRKYMYSSFVEEPSITWERLSRKCYMVGKNRSLPLGLSLFCLHFHDAGESFLYGVRHLRHPFGWKHIYVVNWNQALTDAL
jgi:hypothetical protein